MPKMSYLKNLERFKGVAEEIEKWENGDEDKR